MTNSPWNTDELNLEKVIADLKNDEQKIRDMLNNQVKDLTNEDKQVLTDKCLLDNAKFIIREAFATWFIQNYHLNIKSTEKEDEGHLFMAFHSILMALYIVFEFASDAQRKILHEDLQAYIKDYDKFPHSDMTAVLSKMCPKKTDK